MISEWFVVSQKKVTHAFSFNQVINERTRETSTWSGFNSHQSKKDRTIGYSQDLFGLFMTLGFAVLLTMVIIRFRSLQKKHHPTSAHKTRTGRREGKRSHLIRSSSRNQLMRKLSLMRRILNLFPKPPIQHKNSNSLFDTLYLTPSLSLMRIIREPSHHDFKKLKKKFLSQSYGGMRWVSGERVRRMSGFISVFSLPQSLPRYRKDRW